MDANPVLMLFRSLLDEHYLCNPYIFMITPIGDIITILLKTKKQISKK